jgi:acyl-CoA reductase-like NAD-dependent aldehyde dehydrogenase
MSTSLHEVNFPAAMATRKIGPAMVDDPRVRKLSFTGSTEVGGELLALAARSVVNDTEHGLVAYVYTRDLAVGEAIETGMIGLNRGIVSDPAAPFGGVKQSGLGREGGHHGLVEFLEPKYCAFDEPLL